MAAAAEDKELSLALPPDEAFFLDPVVDGALDVVLEAWPEEAVSPRTSPSFAIFAARRSSSCSASRAFSLTWMCLQLPRSTAVGGSRLRLACSRRCAADADPPPNLEGLIQHMMPYFSR